MADKERWRRFVWQAGEIEVIEPEDTEEFFERLRREEEEERRRDAQAEQAAEHDAPDALPPSDDES